MPDPVRGLGGSAATAPVLQALASLYEASRAARTGRGTRDFLVGFRELLRAAGCADGDPRALAERDLHQAEAAGLLRLERHSRDSHLIERVRLPLASEAALFAQLDRVSPSSRREALARQFEGAADPAGCERWRGAWTSYCQGLARAARNGESIAPFDPADPAGNQELLDLLPRVLDWSGESLIRFASTVLCRDSKRLAALSLRLGRALATLTGGAVVSLESVGIVENPRSVLVHGPVAFELGGRLLDLEPLSGPVRLSEWDVAGAAAVHTRAPRCVTVENETTFLELAKLRCGDLLIQTSFPGAATRALMSKLPAGLDFFHFGDSDPEGFDILRDLRERSGRTITALHMRFRASWRGPELTPRDRALITRLMMSACLRAERPELERIREAGHLGAFEQEFLGRPPLRAWPYYPEAD